MQVQNNKEEVPFAHYEEKFASLDPQEAAARCGVPFENGRFTVTLLGTAYQIAWPKYAISSEDEAAFALRSLPCQTFLLRFLLEGRAAEPGPDACGVHVRHAGGEVPCGVREDGRHGDLPRRRGLPV